MSLKKEINILRTSTRYMIFLGTHISPLMDLTTNCESVSMVILQRLLNHYHNYFLDRLILGYNDDNRQFACSLHKDANLIISHNIPKKLTFLFVSWMQQHHIILRRQFLCRIYMLLQSLHMSTCKTVYTKIKDDYHIPYHRIN